MESRTSTSLSTSVSLSHPRVKKLRKNKDEGSKDEAMDETVWSKLPAAMFVKIMQFLPPASLLQQRTLSKWVYQATSSVSFNHLYRKQRNRVNQPWLLLVQTHIHETIKIISAYDFCLEKWHKIPMGNLPIKFNVVASAGGLLLCEAMLPDKLYMCNPLTRTWRELPPRQLRSKTVVGVVHVQEDPNDVGRDAFKVVVGGGKIGHMGFSSEVYDSRTDSWKMMKPIFEINCFGLEFSQYKGSLYSLISSSLSGRGVIFCNLERGIWRKVKAAMPEDLMQVNIVECNDRLFMVGILTASRIKITASRIKIWMLDDDAKNWEEIATIPPDIYKNFLKFNKFQPYFSCTSTYYIGKGRYIYLKGVSSPLVLKFDIDLKTWTWMPKHSLKGMFLNPRLELDK